MSCVVLASSLLPLLLAIYLGSRFSCKYVYAPSNVAPHSWHAQYTSYEFASAPGAAGFRPQKLYRRGFSARSLMTSKWAAHANSMVAWCIPSKSSGESRHCAGRNNCNTAAVVYVFGRSFHRQALMEHAVELGSQIAARSPVAMQGSKINLNYARDHTVAQALQYQVLQ